MKKLLSAILVASIGLTTVQGWAAGNTRIESFNQAKKLLEQKVYFDHRETFYCRATFDSKKNVKLPEGFTTQKHEKRAHRVEWEHVVPAENFGVHFRSGETVMRRVCAATASRSKVALARKRSTRNSATCRPIFTTFIRPSVP